MADNRIPYQALWNKPTELDRKMAWKKMKRVCEIKLNKGSTYHLIKSNFQIYSRIRRSFIQ